MKVLMFGWEFPPFKSGGLGTACYGLTKGLSRNGVNVTFVMPQAPENADADFVKLVGANALTKGMKIRKIKSILTPYMTMEQYGEKARQLSNNPKKGDDVYGTNMFEEIERLSLAAKKIAAEEPHDIIHAHDWMTYEAGYFAKLVSGKPLVVHIHATEYDRTAENPNIFIRDREAWGLRVADKIITNSNFTKQNVMKYYDIPSEKIAVVHWGIDEDLAEYELNCANPFKGKDKIVLFLGRVTIQKGPDYFVNVARKVVDFYPNVKFVVAGNGDMLQRMINMSIEQGIADKMIYTGFLTGADVHRAFQMADLYVMPSVAEPFGLVALESLKNRTPILISKQSGVSEVLNHALKTDFWDINEMANKIVNVLQHDELREELRDNSYREVQKFNLDEPARKCRDVYEEVMRSFR